jgi:UDP-3-O-[3-hydroxymyristoyl] glucosamine N-acyltransferase
MPQHSARAFTLAEIAARLGGDVLGEGNIRIAGVSTLVAAGDGEISFLANRKYRSQLQNTRAAAVLLSPADADAFAGPRIITSNPYAYYARVASLLNPVQPGFSGIHPSAVVQSEVPASVAVGPKVCVGQGVRIGENVVLHAGCVIGDDAEIGADSIIYPNVTIYHGCTLGQRVIIHSGAVIGADGFGFAPDGNTWVKIPQIGVVRIGDDVEIGANTTVDRGALEDTVIDDGCKIDNLVQIAHNCRIGPNSVLAGCVGVAGSVTMGEHCVVGGAGMVTGHLSLAAGTVISAGSLVMKSITEAGRYTGVFPLDTHEDWIKNAAHIRRLSKLADRVAELEKQLREKKD